MKVTEKQQTALNSAFNCKNVLSMEKQEYIEYMQLLTFGAISAIRENLGEKYLYQTLLEILNSENEIEEVSLH